MRCKMYMSVCCICTNFNIFFYFLLQQFMWIISAVHNASRINTFTSALSITLTWSKTPTCTTYWIMLHKSTCRYDPSPPCCFGQDTNINAVHHVTLSKTKINTIHHVTLSKTQMLRETTLLKFEQMLEIKPFRHQLRLNVECRQLFPVVQKLRLLNEIRMSTFLRHAEIGHKLWRKQLYTSEC